MYVVFAPPEQTPSRTWKVHGPKAEHFLASYSCAKLIFGPGALEDLQRILCWVIVQYLYKRPAWQWLGESHRGSASQLGGLANNSRRFLSNYQ